MANESLAWFTAAVAFAVAMSATPGPNNAMVAASGATYGLRRTLPHLLGIAAGVPVMLLAVALGAGALLRGVPWLAPALRWVGAAYLLWLAWRIATAEPAPDGAAPMGTGPLSFWQAAIFQWVNPKAWVMSVGAVSNFAGGEGGSATRALLLATIMLVVSVPITACWTLLGVGAARALRGRRALRLFNVAMALLLVASLVPMLLR